MSNQRHWEAPMQTYVGDLLAGKEGPRGKDFNMRWVASMVADVHRILTRGGIFSYPLGRQVPRQGRQAAPDVRSQPDEPAGRAGRRRGEHRPHAHARGAADRLHQRVPVFLGSREEVAKATEYHLAHDAKATSAVA
jgi:fructose-1,6-bisphosphatase I